MTAVSSSRTTLTRVWPGREALEYFDTDGAHLDALDQRLHDRKGHVGLEQGDTHFSQRLADVCVGQTRATAQAFDRTVEALAEGFEHGMLPVIGKTLSIAEG
jgi:hypothetical protein